MVNAAREAARTVAVQQGTPTSALTSACTKYLKGIGQTFTMTYSCSGGQDVNVTITVPAANASLFNSFGMFSGNIPATVSMYNEVSPSPNCTTTTYTCQ